MTASARPVPGSPEAEWTVAAVARRLGVAPGTLRSWSRRYGIGPAGHTAGRHRRYTDADLAELDTMRDLVAQGMALSAAATIARDRHRAPPRAESERGCSAADAVGELAAAAGRLDLGTATAILANGLGTHGVIATWEHLCRPALHDLDLAAAADRGCTDAHLLLSWAISTCLHRLPATIPRSGARPVLLACAAAEHHTLPAEALYAALVERGLPARMLGSAVPDAALLHAARRLRPTAVVVWSQRRATGRPDGLDHLIPHTDTVLAAGPGWLDSTLPPTVIRVDGLSAAVDLIADRVSVTSGRPSRR